MSLTSHTLNSVCQDTSAFMCNYVLASGFWFCSETCAVESNLLTDLLMEKVPITKIWFWRAFMFGLCEEGIILIIPLA